MFTKDGPHPNGMMIRVALIIWGLSPGLAQNPVMVLQHSNVVVSGVYSTFRCFVTYGHSDSYSPSRMEFWITYENGRADLPSDGFTDSGGRVKGSTTFLMLRRYIENGIINCKVIFSNGVTKSIGATIQPSSVPGDRCTKLSRCVEHSTCVSGLCTCQPGYRSTSSGLCVFTTLLRYGDACIFTSDCGTENALCAFSNTTGSTVCACSPGRWFSSARNSCDKIALGDSCTTQADCSLVAHSECVESVCKCVDGYYRDSEDGCSRKSTYGEQCTSRDRCLTDNAICTESPSSDRSTCSCPDGLYYNSHAESCDNTVAYGNGCLSGDACQTTGAECFQSSDGHRICQCPASLRYFQTRNACESVEYGENCTNTLQCSTGNALCLFSLTTNNISICTCSAGQRYNSTSNSCDKVQLGDTCLSGTECSSIAHSACVGFICQCVAETYTTLTGECRPTVAYGDQCESNVSCQTKYAECSVSSAVAGVICQCPRHLRHNEIDNICEEPVPLGEQCLTVSTCQTTGAECSRASTDGNMTCQCPIHLTHNHLDDVCQTVRHRGDCTNTAQCSTINAVCRFSSETNNSTCSCPTAHSYNDTMDSCDKVQLDGGCMSVTDCSTIENSECIGFTCQCTDGYYRNQNGTCSRSEDHPLPRNLTSVQYGGKCLSASVCQTVDAECSFSSLVGYPICQCPASLRYNQLSDACEVGKTFASPCTPSDVCRTSGALCKETICACPENLIHNTSVDACIATVAYGDKCSSSAACRTQNAECSLSSTENYTVCQCPTNLRYNPSRLVCEFGVVYGGSCLATDVCRSQGAVCSGSKCICPTGQIYKFYKRECVKTGVGRPCITDEDCADISNSVCEESLCQCAANYQNLSGSCSDGLAVSSGFATEESGTLLITSCIATILWFFNQYETFRNNFI